jgi:hypothetical protein
VPGLSSDRTHLCPLQRINKTALPNIRIPNNADSDTLRLWLVCLYHPQERWGSRRREVCALGGGRGPELEGGGRVSEVPEPGLGVRAWDEVDLVQHENELLAIGLLPPAHLFFNETAATSIWVAGIEDEEDEVRFVDEFVQVPDEVFSCVVKVWIRVARRCWCW